MISLNKYSKYINFFNEKNKFILSYSNIDDVFRHLKNLGIDEIEINQEQMGMIINLFVANSANTELGAKASIEGKTDKFMGIKLFLIN